MEYTTTDISKCLGIKRERLKIWMSKEYVKPSVKASGPGTKNLFSKADLYYLKLFTSLVERGFPREEAANRIEITRMNPYSKPEELCLIGFFRFDNLDESKGYPLIIYAESPEEFLKDGKFHFDEFFKFDCDDLLIINFKKIRETVDKALPH